MSFRFIDQIAEILGIVRSLSRGLRMAQSDIDALRNEVAESRTIMQSAKTLIEGLAERLGAAADDPAEIRAIAAELSDSTDELAEAVAANTVAENEPDPVDPAEPAPPVDPAPPVEPAPPVDPADPGATDRSA